MDEPEVGEMQSNSPNPNLRLSRQTLVLREDDSDNDVNSPRCQMGVQRGQTWKKIEEFSNIRTLNELVQRQIQEAKLQFHSGSMLITAISSYSLLSEKIL